MKAVHLYISFLAPALCVSCSSWPTDRQLSCGDGDKAEEEVCDAADLGGKTCTSLVGKGWEGGTLACAADCSSLDESGCYRCGDGKVNGKETCDVYQQVTKTCEEHDNKYSGGALGCKKDCSGYDVSGCAWCGDGKITGKEVCDTNKQVALTCKALGQKGYSGGPLKCKSDCSGYDESACYSCGDNKKNGQEVCDGADVGGLTCQTFGKNYHGGTLKCQKSCTNFDDTACTWCGDGKINGKEACDGAALGGKTCKTVNKVGPAYARGALACTTKCDAMDTGACTYWDAQWLSTGGSNEQDSGTGVGLDSAGNIYMAGWSRSRPVLGGLKKPQKYTGAKQILVAKLDKNGKFLHSFMTYNDFDSEPLAIAVDSAGNSYITGKLGSTLDFATNNASAGTCKKLTYSASYPSAFVIKLDKDLKCVWATSITGKWNINGDDIGLDAAGNVYVTGTIHDYQYDVKFGSTVTLSTGAISDLYVAKLDSTGKFLWAVSAGGNKWDTGKGIAVDAAGNSTITGRYNTGVKFFNNKGNTKKVCPGPTGNNDVYVTRLDTNGNCTWVATATGAGDDYGYGLALDGLGNTYVTGRYNTTSTFGSVTLTSTAHSLFVAKLDSAGKWKWAVSGAGASSTAIGSRIRADAKGNAYIAGKFTGKITFGGKGLTSQGNNDLLVAKLSPSGKLLWAATGGGLDGDMALGVALDATGGVLVTGGGSAPFKLGDRTGTSYGYKDIFITRITSTR